MWHLLLFGGSYTKYLINNNKYSSNIFSFLCFFLYVCKSNHWYIFLYSFFNCLIYKKQYSLSMHSFFLSFILSLHLFHVCFILFFLLFLLKIMYFLVCKITWKIECWLWIHTLLCGAKSAVNIHWIILERKQRLLFFYFFGDGGLAWFLMDRGHISFTVYTEHLRLKPFLCN